ncbi:hypothetical protein [Flagellimonas beolgyonensis]|uniref:hypothetical protein n=1 Tax=Flagellimonas beolgyonensis TaxID=864064 RepID=UPI000F8CBF77|nr:hypothetical protein [Allomuricauda beolgyonensis]
MKILVVLLSIFTLLLSSFPCCEDNGSCYETLQVDQCGHDDSEKVPHEKDGPCSPFYTCGQCSGFTLTYGKFIDLVIIEIDLKSILVPYLEFEPKEVYSHFLKPPRSFEV